LFFFTKKTGGNSLAGMGAQLQALADKINFFEKTASNTKLAVTGAMQSAKSASTAADLIKGQLTKHLAQNWTLEK
jgi:hypothetical protein